MLLAVRPAPAHGLKRKPVPDGAGGKNHLGDAPLSMEAVWPVARPAVLSSVAADSCRHALDCYTGFFDILPCPEAERGYTSAKKKKKKRGYTHRSRRPRPHLSIPCNSSAER